MTDGPDDGHTFRITSVSRGSYKVVGEEHHSDAPYFEVDFPFVVEVRAWSLTDAMRKAADLPFDAWTRPGWDHDIVDDPRLEDEGP